MFSSYREKYNLKTLKCFIASIQYNDVSHPISVNASFKNFLSGTHMFMSSLSKI